jgi:glycosyltransferase involved in cell wall biosynthesis
VIVPVKDRAVLLTQLLDALSAQTYGDFETIVVDDGSTDGSGDVARDRIIAGRRVCVLEGAGEGAVRARNLASEQAGGEIFAFTDSDCVPHPDWLLNGVAAMEEGFDIVNGFTRPTRGVRPLERSMESGTEGLFPTCNMFYRRDAFMNVGGFDEGIGVDWGFRPDKRAKGDGFGEDTVLGWKVARQGKVKYAPDALVEHHVFPPDYPELISRTVRVAGFPAMIREIPELRGSLCRWGIQLGRRTRLPVYGFVLAIALRKRGAAAGLFGMWAALRFRELQRYPASRAEQLKALPIEMGIDVLTAGSLAVGSVKARSLVI